MQWNDLITGALLEIGAVSQGDTPSNDDMSFSQGKLNELLDEWAARKAYVYSVVFTPYTLQANLNPHTIGPNGTFNVTQRPVRLEGAAIILNTTTPNTDMPINIRDDDWWNFQRVKSLPSNVPTDVYYSPDFPLGQLFFWPVPNFAYGVRLATWDLIPQIANFNSVISLPPGYQKALRLSLAEDLISPFRVQMDATQLMALNNSAKMARKAIQGNNNQSPRMSTAEAGQPQKSGKRSDFNWADGSIVR